MCSARVWPAVADDENVNRPSFFAAAVRVGALWCAPRRRPSRTRSGRPFRACRGAFRRSTSRPSWRWRIRCRRWSGMAVVAARDTRALAPHRSRDHQKHPRTARALPGADEQSRTRGPSPITGVRLSHAPFRKLSTLSLVSFTQQLSGHGHRAGGGEIESRREQNMQLKRERIFRVVSDLLRARGFSAVTT